MKMCQVCGSFVEDYEDYCPECGAAFPSEQKESSIGLTLKENTETYKRATNPMGTTISNGDEGLTSVLMDGMEEDGYYQDIDGSFSSINYSFNNRVDDEPTKHKSKVGKYIFTVLFFAAIAFGIYMFVTNVLLKKEGAATYQEAMQIYVDAVNNKDEEALSTIVPPYHNSVSLTAKDYLNNLQGVTIKYVEKDVTTLSKQQKNIVMDTIKMEYGKTVVPDEAFLVTARVKYTTERAGSTNENTETVQFLVFQIDKRCYLFMDTFDIKLLDLNQKIIREFYKETKEAVLQVYREVFRKDSFFALQ